ncbi:hypothetical protein VNO80_19471 [Phaseolus coccineus]|uniref:Uncharacterized protein n=1 Tax=Phaseolus coccineus TaxID=3886 RepID=A0AAN9MFQ4_PHACN
MVQPSTFFHKDCSPSTILYSIQINCPYSMRRCYIVLCILKHYDVNVATLIFDSIHHFVLQQGGTNPDIKKAWGFRLLLLPYLQQMVKAHQFGPMPKNLTVWFNDLVTKLFSQPIRKKFMTVKMTPMLDEFPSQHYYDLAY